VIHGDTHVGNLFTSNAWGITFKVEAPVIAVLLHRLGTAVADHDALSLSASA
jgi:hypothetical protein